ncbi:MAG: RsmD family RNA methyltransferase [Candidatus Woesebacteria bacterium]
MRLRVIAGVLGSRLFDAPNGFVTHPMGDRVRSALFNSLGDIQDFEVLDAFAGSGAMSFECVSRGAKSTIAVERDRRAQKVIEKNITDLDLHDKVKLIKAPVKAWSEQNKRKLFDLIICDPPYNDLQLSTVSLLTRHLKNNGLMVLSYPGRESAPIVNGVVVVDKSLYGEAALAYYRKSTQ